MAGSSKVSVIAMVVSDIVMTIVKASPVKDTQSIEKRASMPCKAPNVGNMEFVNINYCIGLGLRTRNFDVSKIF